MLVDEEAASEVRESETSESNNRYTQVENDFVFNPVEGYEEEKKDDNENKENEANIPQSQSHAGSISNPKKKEIKKLKIILIGELGVGKSSLINRYVDNKFVKPPEEAELKIKNIDVDDNTVAELSINDTTNEEKLGKITKNYYKDAHGAIIVFDLTNKPSFNKVKFWLKEINSNAPRDIVLCLLGNKSELTTERNVAYEDAKDIAGDNLYYEVSAKTGNNVSLAFEQLMYEIIEKQNEEIDNPDKVPRGKEGRRTADLKDINEINRLMMKKKKCC